MADIFVSYKREDQEQLGRVIPIVRALEAEGFDVFYDVHVPPGSSWEQVLESKISQSRCVIVLWSDASVDSDWVKEEAEIAKTAGKIIPVFLDPVSAPFGFSRIEGANLVNWDGDLTDREWQNLVAAVKNKIGDGKNSPRPDVKRVAMPSPAKQNGGSGKAGLVLVAILLLALLAGGGYFGLQMMNSSSVTNDDSNTVLAEKPDESGTDAADDSKAAAERLEQERKAFDVAKSRNTIAGWEAFLSAYPDGKFADDAKAALAQLKQELADKEDDDGPVLVRPVPGATMTPLPGTFTPIPGTLTPVVKEDCINYGSGNYSVKVSNGGQLAQLVSSRGATPLSARGDKAEVEMSTALKIVSEYGLAQQCFVSRPNATLRYWKTSAGTLPTGTVHGEDCMRMDRSALEVVDRSGRFTVVSGRAALMTFDTKTDADKAVAILRKYGANYTCYVGRPAPSMMYLKR